MSENNITRRRFVGTAAAAAGCCLATSQTGTRGKAAENAAAAETPAPNAPIGSAKGLHPGRVAWVHDPAATNWEGPGDGHWWESSHTDQSVVDKMIARAVCGMTGENGAAGWDRLFKHFNQTRGNGGVGYKPGQKIAIKVNFVGLIWRWDTVNPENYDLKDRRDYMNTAPQMMRALLRQLVETVGVEPSDISIGDSLAIFSNEYHEMLHGEYPDVRYVDQKGLFGRVAVKPSSVPIHWSCRPQGCLQDFIPDCFEEADYLINLANLKSHTATGVTLCGKNHYGSLVRWPAQKGYYDLHKDSFASGMGKYRNLVDLTGHSEIGGKTLLYLIDGLYAGRHPIDRAPMKWNSTPFNGDWTSSLLASQDPVAIDSVAYDLLRTEWEDHPRKSGAEDYLHEAAQADDPPSGTFYDPEHPNSVARLASLGVHEHWNDPMEKKYSRNLGTGEGIELVAMGRI